MKHFKLTCHQFVICSLATLIGCTPDEPERGLGTETETEILVEAPTDGPINPNGVDCSAASGITPVCGFKNPEDLRHIPGTSLLLVSEMGEFMLDTPGHLRLFDIDTQARQPLDIDWTRTEPRWGDPACPAPDVQKFSPHGIDLVALDDETLKLLVVNHGGRESIEFFEVTTSAAGSALIWQGCALPPGDPFINDVVGLKQGGFFVTQMWNKSTPFEDVAAQLLRGEATGWVWEWQPEQGFSVLPDSKELMPNGIAISADEQTLFINIYMGHRLIKYDRSESAIIGSVSVRQPDNVTRDNDGMLWVASHQQDPIAETCTMEFGPCLLPFEVVRIDPETLERETLLSHVGQPMGYSTVALKVENTVYLGTAHGDRIAHFTLEGKSL